MATPPQSPPPGDPGPPRDGPQLLAVAPYFFVRDVRRSAEWYRDALGFTFDRFWGTEQNFCMVRRDGLTVMLCQTPDDAKISPNAADGEAWDAYVWVADAERLFGEFKAKAVDVVYEPSVTFYDNREFAVKDPDGYVLAFGQNLTRET